MDDVCADTPSSGLGVNSMVSDRASGPACADVLTVIASAAEVTVAMKILFALRVIAISLSSSHSGHPAYESDMVGQAYSCSAGSLQICKGSDFLEFWQ